MEKFLKKIVIDADMQKKRRVADMTIGDYWGLKRNILICYLKEL